jgi:beta-fructofuranosidase
MESGFHRERGWLNDPHGITYRPDEGRYHLFFQLVADSTVWQPQLSWGHAVSTDLEHWTELAPALAPDADDAGCWSGCLVDEPGAAPRIFYTAVSGTDAAAHQLGRIRSAVPLDDAWLGWRKEDGGLDAPPGLTAFRDPFVLREERGWRMVVGAGEPGGVAAAVSFVSADLGRWTYDGVLARRPSSERDGVWTGTVWECPQLVEVDGVWALVVSVGAADETHHVAYAFGTRNGGRFTAGTWRRLTSGAPYAASAFRDAAGRPALMCWLRGVDDPEGQWAGTISVPYRLVRVGEELVLDRWSG